MIDSPTLLTISGSLRRGSFNTLLCAEAARLFAPARIETADIRLPLYDGDLEDQGMPPEVLALVAQIRAADAVVISTPEYNGNLSGVLKNALDWASRVKPQPLIDKPLAILSAAAGRSGGARAQYSLRHCLVAFQPRILQGPEAMIAGAYAAFDEAGRLKDDASRKMVAALMQRLRALI